jgi:hypothetical protein
MGCPRGCGCQDVRRCARIGQRIDDQLSVQGTSLVELTESSFPELQAAKSAHGKGAAYVMAVTGR